MTMLALEDKAEVRVLRDPKSPDVPSFENSENIGVVRDPRVIRTLTYADPYLGRIADESDCG
jgi:hypothetical protein